MTSRLREAALWTGAVLGLLSAVAGVAVLFFGFTFLIFRSGSMGPGIPTGSLALARTTPATELEPGDVVSVLAANGARVTHRLVSSTLRGDEASLVLQGDANGTPDDEIYQVTEAEVEIASVPYAGYVVTVLLSPAGLVGAGCLSGMLLLMGFGSSGSGSDDTDAPTSDGGRHRGDKLGGRRGLVAAGVGVTMVAATVVGAGVAGTSAYFSDQATVTSGMFSMATPAPTIPNPPRGVKCDSTLLNTDAYIVWTVPIGSAQSSYTITYVSGGMTLTDPLGPMATQWRPPDRPNKDTTYQVTVTANYDNAASAAGGSSSIRWEQNGPLRGWRC